MEQPTQMKQPLHLIKDHTVREIVRHSDESSLMEQLLSTAVLTLINDVARLTRRVSDLEGRETV